MSSTVDGEELTAAVRERFRRWRWYPDTMVREEFGVEPDAWQKEALRAFPHNQRLAMKACKGPGKTTTMAWLILNFLATRPHPKIGATSITGDNLDTNLWPEISKWMGKSQFFSETFVWTASRVSHRYHPQTWFAVARTWPKQADADQQADALAGIHADYVAFFLDEVGGIPQAVMATAEAVLASGIESKVVIGGNPTHTTGPLYAACTSQRHLWYVVTITGDPLNPQRSPRISVQYAQEQIDLYGRDNPWVMVNVLGEFPPASINALLGIEDVERAMNRHLRPDAYEWAQKRIGVDVARFGDDRTVLFPRQGLASFKPVILRQVRTTEIATKIMRAEQLWQRSGSKDVLIMVDDTGHWGHGAVDILITAGKPVIPIIASAPSLNKRYKTVRDELWLAGADWVKKGGVLPKIPEMVRELIEPTYSFIGGKFVVEPKDLVKKRLGYSPDLADGLFQTFALPDAPADIMQRLADRSRASTDYHPYEIAGDHMGRQDYDDGVGKVSLDFDPFDRR
jgi:hypothetical protein